MNKCKNCGKEFEAEAQLRGHNMTCNQSKRLTEHTVPAAKAVARSTELPEPIGDEDRALLIKACYFLSKLCAPSVFKYASAAGVTEEEMKDMHETFKELYEKYN